VCTITYFASRLKLIQRTAWPIKRLYMAIIWFQSSEYIAILTVGIFQPVKLILYQCYNSDHVLIKCWLCTTFNVVYRTVHYRHCLTLSATCRVFYPDTSQIYCVEKRYYRQRWLGKCSSVYVSWMRSLSSIWLDVVLIFLIMFLYE